MEIYVLRHGIAEERHPSGDDSARRLTPEGKQKLKAVLRLAGQAGVEPDLILSSPYVRAAETAAVAVAELGYRKEVLSTRALEPGGPPETVWEEIRTHRDAKSILLAGHEPQLSQLVAYLLSVPSLLVDMKKGALVRVDVDQFGAAPRAVLRWMLVPKLALTSE